MPMKISVVFATIAIAGCSSSSPAAKGRVVVAVTVDWEGAYLSADALDALDALRGSLGTAPITHFVSAAYFTKTPPVTTAATTIERAVRKGDELALHLHAWRSLAVAGGLAPKLSPSYLTGTDKLLELEDGDIGYDLDLDAYSVPELRVLIRTSRLLLEPTHVAVSKSFRAGGYLGTPKVLQAIQEEGFTVDSSAMDARQLDDPADSNLQKRVKALWPRVEPATQPWRVQTPGGSLLELPIAGFADHATADQMVAVIEAARTRLQSDPAHDVFVVLAFDLETAHDFAGRIGAAIAKVSARRDLADSLLFATVANAAARARSAAPALP
jgi:hypothetical protein